MAIVKECNGCGTVDRLKGKVVSVRHNLQTAHHAQKTIKATVEFTDVETGDPALLCQHCQALVIGGMNVGQNWE